MIHENLAVSQLKFRFKKLAAFINDKPSIIYFGEI
jgi:hypothetical protein